MSLINVGSKALFVWAQEFGSGESPGYGFYPTSPSYLVIPAPPPQMNFLGSSLTPNSLGLA